MRTRAAPQRAIVIYDRGGHLVEELALPPPEAAAGVDPKASCCAALLVRGAWCVWCRVCVRMTSLSRAAACT